MNEDETLDYLNVDYPSIVVCKDDLVKTLTLVSKISQPNSSSIECNSLAFVPKWKSNTVDLMITNDLTYFKISIELLGDKTKALEDIFSIRVDFLNKIKPFLKDKVLFYKKGENLYVRLIDGDLLVNYLIPNYSKLTFTSSINSFIYEARVDSFCSLLSTYKSLQNDFADKWLTFDGEKACFCGSTYYVESKIRTPKMCLLFADVDLLIKLVQFYSESTLEFYSTDSIIPKLHIKVDDLEIEILNVLSSMQTSVINSLHDKISNPSYSVPTAALNRIFSLGNSVPDMESDYIMTYREDRLLVILKSSKGSSEFNLVTTELDKSQSDADTVEASLSVVGKILNCINSSQTEIALNKIYTTFVGDNLKAIIINK